jgi:hypothetical protein
MTNWPTSPDGLLPGAVWNNGGIVSVVPGSVPDLKAAAVLFGATTPDRLLQTGAGDLPMSDPGVANQMWNAGGVVAVSVGSPVLGLSSDGGLLVLTSMTALSGGKV